jgi:ABC-2 type transport system ATP-binding protein
MEIVLNHVSKTIQGKTILDDVNAVLKGGCIYGIRGKNGCGKTMLMRSIAGLMRPTSGTIHINGRQLYKEMEVPDSIGILIENPAFLPEYNGYQNLKLLADIRKRISTDEIKHVIQEVGLNPEDKRKVRKYSLGMKQRLGIAAAIMETPEIILLDEPINAIDEKGVAEIREVLLRLRSEERIILIACHDKEELDYLSDRIFMMEEGRIIREDTIDREASIIRAD